MSKIVLEELSAYLIAQGVARAGGTTGSLPPVWLDPKDGPRQPETPDTLAVTLLRTGQIPMGHLEGFLEEPVVDVVVRARNAREGELLQRSIRLLLNDKANFTIGALTVQWCLLWRGVQPLPLPQGAKIKTWDSTQSFRMQIRVAHLTA